MRLQLGVDGIMIGSNTIMTHVFLIDNACELNRGHHKAPSPHFPPNQNDPAVCGQVAKWVETDLRIVYLLKGRRFIAQVSIPKLDHVPRKGAKALFVSTQNLFSIPRAPMPLELRSSTMVCTRATIQRIIIIQLSNE